MKVSRIELFELNCLGLEDDGEQKAHYGHGHKLISAEEVSWIVKSLPTVCQEYCTLLLGEDPQLERHQASELPEIVEYQRHTLH